MSLHFVTGIPYVWHVGVGVGYLPVGLYLNASNRVGNPPWLSLGASSSAGLWWFSLRDY